MLSFSLPHKGDLKKDLFRWNKSLLGLMFLFLAFLFLPKFSQAATINISPSGGNFGVGSSFTVNIVVNTQGEPTNTAEARVSYSTAVLDVVSVKQGATYYLASPGSPSKGTGTVYFGGGLPTPGYTGSGGVIGSITFRAKAEGSATVTVDSGKVLLNDGLGTDALNGTSSAKFTITPPPVGTPNVSSTTHPSSDSWYQKTSLALSWTRPNDAYGFSFELDQDANTIPDSTLDTTVTTTKTYDDLKEGTWYFHIKARPQNAGSGFGATTHYRIQIDTQKPLLFDPKLVGESDLNDVSRTPTLEFTARDELSGIDYYSIALDGDVVAEKTNSPFTFNKLSNGPHVIRVIAFDKAGNDRKAELPIIVSGPPVLGFFQRNLTLPLYLILALNLLAVILILILIYFVFRRKSGTASTDDIGRIQAEVDRALEELKLDISKKLLDLSANSSEELLRKEAVVAGSMNKKITSARKKIDSKLRRLKK
ncbi:MAG: cohesin domain-containing protein [Candidatus Doudnabacteria bacterium]|nr:cohesin domain-containing protein [Candidatus Doudnabacteria bacterium]